jgi:cytochrome c-type biogenesis protein CcmH/NrfG
MKKLNVALLLLILIGVFTACQDRQPRQKQAAPPPMPLITPDQIRSLENTARMAPKNAGAWIALGNALFDMNRCFTKEGPHQIAPCAEAANAYQKALELDPKNVNVLVDRGVCLWASGQPEKALAEYRKAMKLDPRHPHAHMNAAVALSTDLNRPAEAAKEFEKYLELAPNAPNADAIRQTIIELKARSGQK